MTLRIPSASRTSAIAAIFVIATFTGLSGGTVSAQQAAPGTATPTPSPPPAASAAQEPDSSTGLLGFFRRATVNGFVDVYYLWSSNGTDPIEYRNFDVTHDRVRFSVAEVVVEKKAVPESRLGFRFDVGGGPVADMVNAAEPGGADYWKAFQQAYVSVLVPAPIGVTVDVGKFTTPIGAEVIESRDNWNLSRSALFSMAIPYYHFGARVACALTPRFTLTGLLVKGWNDVRDNNDSPSAGVSASFSPSTRVTIAQHVMVGPEQPGNDSDLRQVFDTVVTVIAHPKISLMGDLVIGQDSIDGVSQRWHGAAAYLRYQATERVAFSPRYEWYHDADGFTTGTAQALQGLTLTGELRVSDLVARLEARTDYSDQRSFATGGDPTKWRTTIAVGVTYGFARAFR